MKHRVIAGSFIALGVLMTGTVLYNILPSTSTINPADRNGDGTVIEEGRSETTVEIPPYELQPGDTYPHLISIGGTYFREDEDLEADWHLTRYELRNVRHLGEETGTEKLSVVSFRGPSKVTTKPGDDQFLPIYEGLDVPVDVVSAFFDVDITAPVQSNSFYTVSMPFDHLYEVNILPIYDVHEFEIWEKPYFSDPKKAGEGKVKLPAGLHVEAWDLGV